MDMGSGSCFYLAEKPILFQDFFKGQNSEKQMEDNKCGQVHQSAFVQLPTVQSL